MISMFFSTGGWPSLHFIHAASKLALLHLGKGNSLKCFSSEILWRTWLPKL